MRIAVADSDGVRGPSIRIERELDPVKARWPFDEPYENFRLLDPLSRYVAIAVEALGGALDPDSAIVLSTTSGCLWADRQFEASRHADLRPGLFPYTLPSAAIAAIAIRHGIRGPSLCLSGCAESAHEEALRLIAAGDAPAAIVCTGDVVPPEPVEIKATYLTP